METMMRPPRTILEVFENLPEGTLAQLIENELIMSPTPLEVHQALLINLSADILYYVKKNKLGTVRVAPYDVYLDRKNVYQPDIVFIAKENLGNIKSDGLHGTPDMVIEILSPSTAKYDLQEKKDVYERCGVKEYWIIDPVSKQAQGFTLVKNQYEELGKTTETLNSRLLNTAFEF